MSNSDWQINSVTIFFKWVKKMLQEIEIYLVIEGNVSSKITGISDNTFRIAGRYA